MKSWQIMKLGEVGVGSNIALNNLSIVSRKSYLVVIAPNSHAWNLAPIGFLSSTLVWPQYTILVDR